MLREYTLTDGSPVPDSPATTQPVGAYELIQLDHLIESSTNPRRSMSDQGLDELANSIASTGVLQPILVRPLTSDQLDVLATHEIVCGHRRTRAARLAGLDAIPCIVREMDDDDVRIAQLTENLQREGVHPIEEGEALANLLAAGAKADDLARDLGKSRAYVYARAKLARLTPDVRAAAMSQGLPIDIALAIARLPSILQQRALNDCRDMGSSDTWVSVRTGLDRVRGLCISLREAPFSQSDDALLPDVGACLSCAKWAANSPDLADLSADTCTDRLCYNRKALAARDKLIADARERGLEIIEAGANHALTHMGKDAALERLLPVPADDRPPFALIVPPTGMPYLGMAASLVGEVLRTHYAQQAGDTASTPPTAAHAATEEPGAAASGDRDDGNGNDEHGTDESIAASESGSGHQTGHALTDLEQAVLTDMELIKRLRTELARSIATTPRTLEDLRYMVRDLIEAGWLEDIDDMLPILVPGHPDADEDGASCWLGDHLDDIAPDALSAVLLATPMLSELQLRPFAHRSNVAGAHKASRRIGLARARGIDIEALRAQIQSDNAAVPAGDQPAQTAPADLYPGHHSRPAAMYRCPLTGQTWSGRGLKPKWLTTAMESGRILSEFLVTS